MITESLQHCRGVGPVRLTQLHDRGVRTWHDVLVDPERIPAPLRETLVAESRQSLEALERADIQFFVDRFSPQDKGRILAHFLDRTSFFDIETTGLGYDATITVIVCWHRGRLHTFVENENLDEFLDLLDEVELLTSFNGSTFDVPRLIDSFHILDLPCPHLDLRWLCYHRGLKGSLKDITAWIGNSRPSDLAGVGGDLAVELWWAWRNRGDRTARKQLIRYCAADVLLLVLLAHHISDRPGLDADDLWSILPTVTVENLEIPAGVRTAKQIARDFGQASPTKLRTRCRSTR